MDGLGEVKGKRPDAAFWCGKRVFMTGHTGFKGGWLSLWLHRLGAELAGYALAPDTKPNFFDLCGVADVVAHRLGDVRDAVTLEAAMAAFAPDVVIHLAAQPLVRESYAQPVATFATNIMGTAHVLAAVQKSESVRVTLIVTSDKVYAESSARHLESDRLGGHDPYSASKACAELVAASFPLGAGKRMATLRSGNVIGGGDWSADRLVADIMRGLLAEQKTVLRNPEFIRPWQHVLEPLCGYLLAAEALWAGRMAGPYCWNFGPEAASEVAVREVAQRICALWNAPAGFEIAAAAGGPHEAQSLRLESGKARQDLGWQPGWDLAQALGATVGWFQAFQHGADMREISLCQIASYE